MLATINGQKERISTGNILYVGCLNLGAELVFYIKMFSWKSCKFCLLGNSYYFESEMDLHNQNFECIYLIIILISFGLCFRLQNKKGRWSLTSWSKMVNDMKLKRANKTKKVAKSIYEAGKSKDVKSKFNFEWKMTVLIYELFHILILFSSVAY